MNYKNTSFLADIKMQSKFESIKERFQYNFVHFKHYSELNVVLLQSENIGIVF